MGVAPCTNASATVTVSENGSADAGTDGTVTVCSNGASVDLFTQLGGTPDVGGTWSGPSPISGGQFDPSSMLPGTYVYTIAAVAPCTAVSADVQVAVEQFVDAGEDGSATVCSGASEVDLFALLGGSPQPGGAWSGPNGAMNGSFDPGADPSGTYTYTLTGNVCPTAVSEVIMTVEVGPDAGTGQITTICSDSGTFDLFTLLSGSPDVGGTWTNAAGVVIPSTFDPATSSGGDLTYTVEGTTNCPDDEALVSIVVNIAPRSGISGSLSLCVSSAPISLFEGLTGTLDAGGIWTGPDGLPHATIINPAVDGPGDYTYTVAGVPPCVDASSTVTVFIAPLPNAGEDASTSLCSSADPVALFGLLGGAPQPDGVWVGPDGAMFAGTFLPAASTPGVYTYTITGVPPCGSDQSMVTVSVSIASDAGGNGSLSLCENAQGTVQLFDELTGTPDMTGTWTGPDGMPMDGSFTAGVDQEGDHTYTVQGTAPCPAVFAIVDVDVVEVPVADIAVIGNEGCTPAEITLTSGYTGPGSCTWTLWNGEVVNDCAPIARILEEAGTYGVTLVVDAGNGCGADTLDADDLITIYEQPVADFYTLPEAVNTLDPVVQFNNTSTGGIHFEWDFAGLATSTEVNPSYRFSSQFGQDYNVCLLAAASANCTDSICRMVEVEDGLTIHVPNAFTPDGSGFNDGFKPIVIGVSPDYYRFDIFDRWGQPLFGTDDPNAFWDGRAADGTEVQIGVYVWKLVAKDPYSGGRIERIGHVTLVR
jgi:gliding motility-associated-like protein